MSGARRTLAVALGVVVTFAVTVLLAQAGKVETGPTPAPGGVVPASTSAQGIPGRVERQVAELKLESLEQSLANLGDWELWFRPGGYFIEESGRGVMLPLRDEDGSGTVDILLSNRRLLKVYEELGAVPTAQAAELINRHFPLWSQQYSEKYAEYVEKGRRVSPASVGTGGPGTFYIGGWGGKRDDDGLPLLECMRWRLLGLVLVAGNLRLQGTAPRVQQIAEQARAQRDDLYQATELSEGFRALTLTKKSLYNRQVLGYALVQTSPVPEQALAALAATGTEITVKTSPVYDALRTPYDIILMSGPVDYSKGALALEHLAALSDVDFENIFAAAVPR